MPHTLKNWTISAGRRKGTLIHKDGRHIDFGHKLEFHRCTTRIDLRYMSHGMDDTEEKALAGFIAAADSIYKQLARPAHNAIVHCEHGNSRTAFALIVFLARHEGFDYKEAATFVAAGQEERADIKFSLERQVNNKSYNEWLGKNQAQLKDLENMPQFEASNVSHEIVKNKNQVVYFVQSNKSQRRVEVEDEETQRKEEPQLKRRKSLTAAEKLASARCPVCNPR
jgi:hypothetical protein